MKGWLKKKSICKDTEQTTRRTQCAGLKSWLCRGLSQEDRKCEVLPGLQNKFKTRLGNAVGAQRAMQRCECEHVCVHRGVMLGVLG